MDLTAWVLLGVCILAETSEQCLYRVAARRRARWRFFVPAILIHGVQMATWLLLLRYVPLGVVLPLTGANFVAIALASKFLFKEGMGMRRLAGVTLVVVGFALVATGYK